MMTATQKKLLFSALFALTPASAAFGQAVLFHDAFSRPNGPVAASGAWNIQAGALTAVDGAAWTGSPDQAAPQDDLRLLAERADIGDAAVTFQLYTQGLLSAARRPAAAHDGVHVWLRYRDPETLYAVSVARRDGTIRIQKKAFGRYHDLAPATARAPRYGHWERVTAAVRDTEDGSVTIQVFIGGTLVASAVDDGVGGPALRGPGRVGLRGDNARFLFDDFTVTSLDASR